MLSQVAVIALARSGSYEPLAAILLPIGSPKAASLAFAVLFMFACWLTGYWLDKRKIYIRV